MLPTKPTNTANETDEGQTTHATETKMAREETPGAHEKTFRL